MNSDSTTPVETTRAEWCHNIRLPDTGEPHQHSIRRDAPNRRGTRWFVRSIDPKGGGSSRRQRHCRNRPRLDTTGVVAIDSPIWRIPDPHRERVHVFQLPNRQSVDADISDAYVAPNGTTLTPDVADPKQIVHIAGTDRGVVLSHPNRSRSARGSSCPRSGSAALHNWTPRDEGKNGHKGE